MSQNHENKTRFATNVSFDRACEAQKRTLTGRTALVRLDNKMKAGGHRAGYEHAHLPSGVTVAVATAIVPALTFLVFLAIGCKTIAGRRGRGSGAWHLAAF